MEDELAKYDVLMLYSHSSQGEYSSYICHGVFKSNMKGYAKATKVRKALVENEVVNYLEQETSIEGYSFDDYSQTGGHIRGSRIRNHRD